MNTEWVAKNRERIIADCEQYLGDKYPQYRGKLQHPVYKLARVVRNIATKGGLQFRKDDVTLAFRHIDWDTKEFGERHDAFCVSCYSVRSKGFVGINESDISWIEEPSPYLTASHETATIATGEEVEQAKLPLCQHDNVFLAEIKLEPVNGEWPSTIERTGRCTGCGKPIEITYVSLTRPRKG